MKFKDALDQLPVEKKARRLKVIWPLIEAKLAEDTNGPWDCHASDWHSSSFWWIG